MSAPDTPIFISELLHCEVVAEGGRHLGHLHEVTVRREGQGGHAAVGLAYGRRGLLRRLGISRPQGEVPWSDVLEVRPDRITVRRES